jgi:predicted O-methyltransferase YrrM
MIKQSLRKAAYAVAPRYVVDRYLYHKMVREARHLGQLRDAGADQSLLIEKLWRSYFFRPLQKRSEILRLVEVITGLNPSTVCEIGAAGGGTTFLLAKAAAADATLISLDLSFTELRRAVHRRFASQKQKIICLKKDSHEPDTVRAAIACLEGRSLDVLYLDGDHSYEGIKADFNLYSPLVRPGGLIVFHDIVPDYRTRYGIETSVYVGGVPQFWAEIKATQAKVDEIVEDYAQDGFGIGILYWNGDGSSNSAQAMERRDV